MAGNLQIDRNRTLVWLVGISVFLLECAAGYYYNVYVGYYHTDGISRVANAFYVLYSRDPHLGAIGFVWNPLPSMIDMVFLLFYPWIPAMAAKGIAGLLMCAIFASLTAAIVVRAFIERNLPRWSAVVFSLVFSLNPMIFLFGFNGMSDAPFMFFVIWCVYCFLNWLDGQRIIDLAIASFALALAFWCRYEAVPFGFGIMAGCVIAVMWFQKNSYPPDGKLVRHKWARAEGTLAIIAAPLCYSIILWLLLNAVIMNDPLSFLRGEYTNIAQIEGHIEENSLFAAMLNNPVKSSIYAFQKVAVFSAPFLSILFLRLLDRRLFRWDTLILMVMFVSMPLLQVFMLVKGTTLAWLRYFIYVLPVSFAWLPYELSQMRRKWRMAIPLIAMIINFGVLSYAITQPSVAPDENNFLQNSLGRHSQAYYEWADFTGIANYLDAHHAQDIILTDSFSAYFVILQSEFPKRFYISSDFDFKKAISDPKQYQVDYILIPKPGSASVISAINNEYPNLFEHGAAWAELVHDFDSKWRLYKITKSTGGLVE
jgi:hypothetical protein